MVKRGLKVGGWIVGGILLFGLLSVFVLFFLLTANFESQLYTAEQEQWLINKYERNIVQAPPVSNVVLPGGEVQAATLAEWEAEVEARLDARYEEEAGVTATVYDLLFDATYHLSYPGPAPTATVELVFPFPGNLDNLHAVEFLVDGEEAPQARYSVYEIRWQKLMETGEEHEITVRYRADGAQSFAYGLSSDRRFDTLDVAVLIEGLTGSEVLEDALSPTDHTVEEESELFRWSYTGLIPARNIKIRLPERLSLRQRIARLQADFQGLAAAAPFWVGLFLVALAGMFWIDDIRMSFIGYLLVGLGVALFYPLLAFLSGLVGVVPAALLTLGLISTLTIAFLGVSVGWRETWWRAGWLLFIVLVCLSLGMLLPFSGLVLAFGGLLLVATFMWLYARRPRKERTEDEEEVPAPQEVVPAPVETAAVGIRHCPRCGEAVTEGQGFCAACGYDVRAFRRCPECAHEQFAPPDLKSAHCQRCGTALA